jgi:ATP-dependent Clp protease protease subunit
MKKITFYILCIFSLSAIMAPLNAQETKAKEKDANKAEAKKESKQDDPPPPEEKERKPKPAEKSQDAEIEKLRTEIELLTLRKEKLLIEHTLADEELRQRRSRLLRDNEEREFKTSMELAKTKLEIERLTTETELIEKLLAFDAAQHKAKVAKELAALRYKEEKLKAENDLYVAQNLKEASSIKHNDAVLKSEKLASDYELASVELKIKEHSKIDELEALAEREKISYLKNPLDGDKLIISDRRIALNDAITYTTAERITERISFFNNKDSEQPIFLVIDYSPGGSVMAGYRILKAMEGSQAPVHVVLKSFAASMAAAITTLADTSYAYPNALILHHQMSYGIRGNMTQQKEMLDESQEWWKRLASPIAKKMGITMDEFIAQMYKNDSGGDWVEFADQAKKLKWVDHIVSEVRETSLLEHPDKKPKPPPQLLPLRAEDEPITGEQISETGERFHRLPRLVPYDFYYLYNPDNFYRL